MNLTTTIQESLLAILCYGETGDARQVIELVEPRLFDAYYSDLAQAASSYLNDFNETPGEQTLDLVENLKQRYPKRASMIGRVYRSTTETWDSGVNAKYFLREAAVFSRHRGLKDAVAELIDHLQKDTPESVEEAEGVLRRLQQKRADVYEDEVILQDTTKSLAFLDEEEEYLPCGIPEFDDFQLGPVRGGLHLLVSAAKRGKSWWLLHLMRQALIHGFTPVYIGLELRTPAVCRRAYQTLFSLTKYPARDLMRTVFELDDERNFVDLRQVRIPRRRSFADPDIAAHLIDRIEKFRQRPPFVIKGFPSGRLTMNGLESYLDHLAQVRGIHPDLVCLDYPDLMRYDRKKDKRDAIGETYVDLRGLAGDRNFAMAAVSQLNRGGAKDSDATGTDVAEDWSKIATADGVFILNQTKSEKRLGLARLAADAMRDGPGGFDVLISQQLAIGQFCMDSVRMSSKARRSISGGLDESEDNDE